MMSEGSFPSTPNQRAFAGKKNRVMAADIRRHIMTGSYLMNNDQTDSTGSSCTLVLPDTVEPVDIEESLSQRKTSTFYDISSCSSPRKISEFPVDDVDIKTVTREVSTLDSPFKSPLGSIEPHVSDILTSFKDDFSIIQRRYQQFGSAEAFQRIGMERSVIAHSLTPPIYESDAGSNIDRSQRVARSASVVSDNNHSEIQSKRFSYTSSVSSSTLGSNECEQQLHSSQSDPTVIGVAQRSSPSQLDNANRIKRQTGRQTNFVSLLPPQKESEIIEKRSPPLFPIEPSATKLVVKILKLDIDPYFEPIFGSMAIYDAKSKRKISENFHFDVNPERIRAMIGSVYKQRCQQGAFNVSTPINDLFLVIRLSKVLSACETSETCEPYLAPKDEKGREKLSQSASDFCKRLGAYRMPLGFMVIDLQRIITGANDRCQESIMGTSSCSVTTLTGNEDAPLATIEDSKSIMSADRVSITSTSTFRRFGSGTSAATVLNRISTPLARRKNTAPPEENIASNLADLKSTEEWLNTLKPTLITVNTCYRYENEKMPEEDLYKIFSDIRRSGGKSTKLKSFPISFSIQVSGNATDDLLTRVTPEMLRVTPYNSESDDLTKEILEFSAADNYLVNSHYRNLLFVNLKSVNFTSRPGTARNIAIKVELMNSAELPQQDVFCTDGSIEFTSSAFSTIIYHNKSPQLWDEIKLRIPLGLDDGYHLLFTFYHISCKANSRDDEVAIPIGFTWIPLYRDGKLATGDFSLPICLERPPASYGYLNPDSALPNTKWLDGHKKLFHLSISALSTVHAQDDYLEKFFISMSSMSSNDRKHPPVSQNVLIEAIRGILKARPQPMVAFLYNVMDKLLALIGRPPYGEEVSTACFETLGHLVKICTHLLDSSLDSHGRSSLLVTFIHYFKISLKESKEVSALCAEYGKDVKPSSPETEKLFNIIESMERSSSGKLQSEVPVSANKALHEELVELWVRSGGKAREMAFINSWFFFELLLKSMAEFLSMTGRFRLAIRRSRFTERFTTALDALSTAVAVEIITRLSKDPRQSFSLANSWAFFLRDALSLMDRGYVLGLVKDFNQTISAKIVGNTDPQTSTLMMIKLDFMRIVCSHEHFVVLNLPYASTSSPNSRCRNACELSFEYKRTHFLVGIVLSDLACILESSTSIALHSRAIATVRNLFSTHEADNRISDASVRAVVAELYLPLIGIITDSVHRLHGGTYRTTQEPPINPKLARAIAGISGCQATIPEERQNNGNVCETVSPEHTQQLLACFCWILKHLDSMKLQQILRQMSSSRLRSLIEVLQLCIFTFEFHNEKGTKDSSEDKVRWRNSCEPIDEEKVLARTLSTEVCLCVLDSIETIITVTLSEGGDHNLFVLPTLFRLKLNILSTNQSVQALDSVFSSLRAFIVKFPELVFEQEAEQCSDMCLHLLRHCTSALPAIRSQAAATIYLLLRESFDSGTSLPRVKMQITMALSTLVSSYSRSGLWLNEDCLRRSLKTVLVYSEMDSHNHSDPSGTCFSEQVKDLVFNLHMILSDTVKMKEYVNDFEMTLDLMHRVAKGYQNNPDLRLTWLLNMAERLAERGLFCEAAQCTLHGSALAAEYIAMMTTDGYMPSGANEFRSLSENILEESAVSDDVVSPENEGICESKHFTASGLVQLVEKSAAYLENAQLYELLPDLYKVIEPVLREWRDYRRLSAIHARISDALSRIEPSLSIVEDTSDAWFSPVQSADKRCFGTYFRVGFYGQRFLDLDGEEFIYKEPPFTKLSEISHRLETFYSEKFGNDVVEVIKDSNNVIRTSHHSDKAYLQITFVDPYFDKWERRRRTTTFERNYNLRRFTYSTPFTKDGKAHGHLKDQYKRRTILTTQFSFPYVKTRLRVVDKEQKVLQPIQVAIEDIEKKTRELSAALNQNPTDAKILQMVLQGCIGTTVNQGPIQIANVFLADLVIDERGKPVDRLQNKLRLAFRDFSKKIADALALNKNIIQPDQHAYQSELEKNYADFTRHMAPIMRSQHSIIATTPATDV